MANMFMPEIPMCSDTIALKQLITYMIALMSQASLASCCVKPLINLLGMTCSVYRRQQSKALAAEKEINGLESI